MYPEIDIGPITLQTFGLMFGLGFVAAGLVIARRFRELGKPPDWAYEMAFAALVGGLVGSRLYFVIENWSDVSDDMRRQPVRRRPAWSGTGARSGARSRSAPGRTGAGSRPCC